MLRAGLRSCVMVAVQYNWKLELHDSRLFQVKAVSSFNHTTHLSSQVMLHNIKSYFDFWRELSQLSCGSMPRTSYRPKFGEEGRFRFSFVASSCWCCDNNNLIN